MVMLFVYNYLHMFTIKLISTNEHVKITVFIQY